MKMLHYYYSNTEFTGFLFILECLRKKDFKNYTALWYMRSGFFPF